MKYIIHTDGGARGNPGPAAIGVVIEEEIKDKRQEIAAFGKRIGETTNNVAEYTAVKEAMKAIKEIETGGEKKFVFFLDSVLVVNQLNGLFKIKDPTLRALATDIRILEQEIGGPVSYSAIPREQNTRADFFVNQALDTQL